MLEPIHKQLRKLANSRYMMKLRLIFELEPYLILWKFLDMKMKTLLDIGCGKGNPISHLMELFGDNIFSNVEKIGVDLYLPYLKVAKAKGLYEDVILADVRYLPFQLKSFDVILMLDLIEHLEKYEGERLLDEAERIAKSQIFVLTPVGFLPQAMYDTPLQIHRSGWSPSDFLALDYKVRGINGFFFLRGEKGSFRFKGILGIFSMVMSHISQMAVYLVPDLAFQMLCIKKLKELHFGS